MFLRCTTRKKNGKEHRYWNLVENRRVAGGQVIQRQVLYLGEINDSQREVWRKSIEVFEDGRSAPRTVALFAEEQTAPIDDEQVIQVRCLPPHLIRLFVAVAIRPSGLVLCHRQINTRLKKSAEGAKMLARTDTALDRPMILFQHIVEILRRSMSTVLLQNTGGIELNDGWRISSLLVGIDYPRRGMVLPAQGFGQKALSRCCVAFSREKEVDRR